MQAKQVIVGALIGIIAAISVANAQQPPVSQDAALSPSAGKALIYVYRDGSSRHAIYYDRIFVNSDYLAVLHRSNYAQREVSPGTVVFAGTTRQRAIPTEILQAELMKLQKKAKEKLRIEVEAGKTYYIRWYVTNGGTKMMLVDAVTGAKEMSGLKPAAN